MHVSRRGSLPADQSLQDRDDFLRDGEPSVPGDREQTGVAACFVRFRPELFER
jgi:hypothetical protein